METSCPAASKRRRYRFHNYSSNPLPIVASFQLNLGNPLPSVRMIRYANHYDALDVDGVNRSPTLITISETSESDEDSDNEALKSQSSKLKKLA